MRETTATRSRSQRRASAVRHRDEREKRRRLAMVRGCASRHSACFSPEKRDPKRGGDLRMTKRDLFAVGMFLAAMAVPARAETPVEKRLRILEQQLREAQEEIKHLRNQVDQQRAIGQATQKQVEQSAEETKTATAEVKKAAELPDWLKRTTI